MLLIGFLKYAVYSMQMTASLTIVKETFDVLKCETDFIQFPATTLSSTQSRRELCWLEKKIYCVL